METEKSFTTFFVILKSFVLYTPPTFFEIFGEILKIFPVYIVMMVGMFFKKFEYYFFEDLQEFSFIHTRRKVNEIMM